jgi:adenylosuccinate lyase
MIPRYTPPEFADLWSDETKFRTWFRVELEVCRSMEKCGIIPQKTTSFIERIGSKIDPKRIYEIEQRTHHDVVAFLKHIEELAGVHTSQWVHFGLTSSDICDTTFAILLQTASALIKHRLNELIGMLKEKAIEHTDTMMIGRTHGMHAEPTTFGAVLGSHAFEMDRARTRLIAAMNEIGFGKLSGAVGTYIHISPEIETMALQKLGLKPEPVATQVIPRDRHAFLFMTFALIASGVERFAQNMRHWQRSEVAEVREAFGNGQTGSSAMPHKRNPILCENLCGLSRVIRAAVIPALENINLWHERDISHSSVERMIAPDVTSTLAFMLERATKLVRDMVVDKDAMKRNLELHGDLCYSEGVLLALVKHGRGRQEAYVLIQKNAMKALDSGVSFKSCILQDPDITSLGIPNLDKCFDINQVTGHARTTLIDRIKSISCL